MNSRAAILTSLKLLGVEADRIREIEAGAQIYGDCGLLNSFQLVCLIATVGEALEDTVRTPVDLFGEEEPTALDQFRDLKSFASLVDRVLSSEAVNPQHAFGEK